MKIHPLLVAVSLAFLAPLAACSHAQTMKKTPAAPSLAQMPESKQAKTPEPTPAAPTRAAAEPEDKAIYFDYNSSLINDNSRPVLQRLAKKLKSDRKAELRIEGNCDERGTEEYNLALGEHRAQSAKKYLKVLGVPPARVKTISYGKDKPQDSGHDEASWAKNRRDDLVVK